MRTHLVTLLILCASFPAMARLEYDSQKNEVQLYGPYVKFNVLKKPYSLGRYQFSLDDITLEIMNSQAPPPVAEPSKEEAPVENAEATDAKDAETQSDDTNSEEKSNREPQSEGELKVYAKWPRFLMSFGRLRLISAANKRILLTLQFTGPMTGQDDKYARVLLDGEGQDLLEALNEPFQACVDQKFEASYVKGCSNLLVYKNGQFQNSFSGKNAASARLNGRKVPKNSQISLDASMDKLSVALRFKSGFFIFIKDKVRILDLTKIAIDPVEKRIGLISGDGSVRPTRLTLKDRFFSFIKEENYFKNRYATSNDWPQNIEDAEMEFSPYQTGASAQMYGLLLPNVPPPFKFQLNDDIPIATYTYEVELKGTKDESEVLAAEVENQLFIHQNQKEFLWKFPAPKKGEVNKNYLSHQAKGQNFYFSKRVFRAHHSAVSGALALSTSPTLDIVPGYNFWAEHWFEQIWDKSSWSYQRWGLSANIYETVQGFKPKDNFPEKISVLPVNFDLMYRLKPGVRPVQSSFGLGLRYLQFKLFRSISADIETQLIGIGGFWHTAPQKIIDDIFNIVPFFRYPKWMEISFYYYPLLIGPEQLGLSFSWQARGRMFISKSWFLDASFNVNAVSFKKPKISGVTAGADEFAIGTAHGTIGIGCFFN